MEGVWVLPRCFCLEQRWTWLLHYWKTCCGYIGVPTLQGIPWSIVLLGGGKSKKTNWYFGGFGQDETQQLWIHMPCHSTNQKWWELVFLWIIDHSTCEPTKTCFQCLLLMMWSPNWENSFGSLHWIYNLVFGRFKWHLKIWRIWH